MDISGVASVASAASAAQTGDAVRISVLKEAIVNQAQGAIALLAAIPLPSNPPHMGQNIDVYA